MNLTIKQKQIPIFFLLLALLTMVLMQGCSGNNNSEPCSAETAPFGSKVTAPADATFSLQSLPTASTDAGCGGTGIFIVTDSNGKPLNDILVNVISSGYVAEAVPGVDCATNLNAAAYNSFVTKTRSGGTIALDIGSNIITKSTATSPSDSEIVQTQVSSCTAGALQKTTITIEWL